MARRCMLAVAGLTLALAAGCGALIVAARDGEPVWLIHRVSRNIYEPSHRVVLAALEVLKAELKDVEITSDELGVDDGFNTPDGKMPKPKDIKIPDDYPGFWLDGLKDDGPTLVNCRLCTIQGNTPDGTKVDVVIRIDFKVPDQNTVVYAQIGRRGNPPATAKMLEKIADHSRTPTLAIGSPEERAALNAAFAPRPDSNDKKVILAGEIRIRKK